MLESALRHLSFYPLPLTLYLCIAAFCLFAAKVSNMSYLAIYEKHILRSYMYHILLQVQEHEQMEESNTN